MGASGGILTIWDKMCFELERKCVSIRYVILKGKLIKHDFGCVLCNVYAPCDAVGNKAVWDQILEVKHIWRGNWCVEGDFNMIHSPLERNGCLYGGVGVEVINNFIDAENLMDLLLVGMHHTWFEVENKRSRLDCFLVTTEWILGF
ncbi:hypothetical protein REPUB_Repub09cG0040700 [Reevesia pubescens]